MSSQLWRLISLPESSRSRTAGRGRNECIWARARSLRLASAVLYAERFRRARSLLVLGYAMLADLDPKLNVGEARLGCSLKKRSLCN
jgi:hypothetical protein